MKINKKITSIIIFCACIIFIFTAIVLFINKNTDKTTSRLSTNINYSDNINLLWQNTIHKILQDPLWKERDAYDAGHFLMIPLHIAFISQDHNKINDFSTFFKNFTEKHSQDNFEFLNTLTKLHFLYLASEYLTLANAYHVALPPELPSIIVESLKSIWYQPAWQWKECGRDLSFKNMNERIEWKLQNIEVPYSYCRAIIDEELFTFAIAADLKTILKDKSPKFIDEIIDVSYKVFKQETVFLDTERWLFQPGVFTDHRDYVYAGWNKIEPDLHKNPIPGIARDTSHSHRFPLWLISLQKGFTAQKEDERAKYFSKLQQGLSKQFLEKALIPPSNEFPNYRTTNFMDGHNGVYRYGYITQGKGRGYGPYELSGTMLLGWWSFLPEKSIRDVYCYISSRFPLSEKEIKTYLGPDTTRDRHPLIKGRAQFENGLLELITKLVCKFKKGGE